ncbi:flagellar basal body-associated FliL family protein [Pseudoneobacillus sp. C159]
MNVYKKSILIIVVITLIGIGGFFIWDHFLSGKNDKGAKEETIDELIKKSVDTETITTNIADGGFVKIKFKLITNTAKNAEELRKLPFLTESTIIKYFNGLKKKEIIGPEGFFKIETEVKAELNKSIGHDFVTKVYIVDNVVQ